MLYVSTRGSPGRVSFMKALLSGRAPDGGLYMPQSLPKIEREEWKTMAKLTYEELSKKLFRFFISENEVPDTDYDGIFSGVYSSIKHPETLPIISVGSYNIMEMWHGPSGSLKDFSLSLVTRFLDYFTRREGFTAVGVVGTLGDTGCAAIQSCLGRDNIRLVVLYPENGVSRIQRLSMTTVNSPFIQVYGCECVSDEFDEDIHKVFNDSQFANKHHLLWLNSINIGRVLAHAVFHIYAYLKFCPEVDQEITIYLPTGGAGNAAGGAIAQRMGLPIEIVAAVNENDSVYKCITNGILQKPLTLIQTHACAIDSCAIPNIERVLYSSSEDNSELVKETMEKYEDGQRVCLPETLQTGRIRSVRVDQLFALSVAQQLWRDHKYMVCPHTAVSVGAAAIHCQQGKPANLALCYSTATSAKFPDFIRTVDPSAPLTTHPMIEGLDSKTEHRHVMKRSDNWEAILRKAIEELYNVV